MTSIRKIPNGVERPLPLFPMLVAAQPLAYIMKGLNFLHANSIIFWIS